MKLFRSPQGRVWHIYDDCYCVVKSKPPMKLANIVTVDKPLASLLKSELCHQCAQRMKEAEARQDRAGLRSY